ncbi:MAG: hypothetical protein U0989_04885 [Azonexus sp.]|nr:hypothetical protein [Azonexus sp.]
MKIGTPLSPSTKRVMLLGAGELGKEVIIAECSFVTTQKFSPSCPAGWHFPFSISWHAYCVDMADVFRGAKNDYPSLQQYCLHLLRNLQIGC